MEKIKVLEALSIFLVEHDITIVRTADYAETNEITLCSNKAYDEDVISFKEEITADCVEDMIEVESGTI